MKIRISGVLVVLALLAGCPDGKPAATARKVELKKRSGSTVELVPTDPQHLSYCLIFTVSEKGVVRQLTMNRQNRSIKCEAGQPIGGVSYRIPVDEGKIRAHVFLSNTQLNAGSVAQQLYELSGKNWNFSVLDLRLPGEVKVETIEFTPETDAPISTGGVVGAGGEVKEPDAVNAGAGTPDGGPAQP